MRMLIVVATVFLTAAAGGAQTAQYDSNNTGSGLVIAGSRWGNEFTGLPANGSITRVTWFQFAPPTGTGALNLRFKESRLAAASITAVNIGPPGPAGLKTQVVAVAFTGTDVWFGFNNYNNHAIAFDTVSNGNGFHAFAAPGGTAIGSSATGAMPGAGNPGNFVARITGPGLPVELFQFDLE